MSTCSVVCVLETLVAQGPMELVGTEASRGLAVASGRIRLGMRIDDDF
jgi:hypothetical protein